MRVYLLSILLMLFICGSAWGGDFYPKADQELAEKGVWTDTLFNKGTMVTTVFRAWLPYEPQDVWEVFIDTNTFKTIHKDYTDSRTLNEPQFKKIAANPPQNVKEFYEAIGQESFPSFLGRMPAKKWTSRVFQRFNFPFPLADRWNVMEVQNDETGHKTGQYRYEYKTVAGNFKELKGYWELFPLPNKPGWTEFRGEYKVDPGIPVPHFLAKSIYRSSTKRSVEDKLKVLGNQGKKKAP